MSHSNTPPWRRSTLPSPSGTAADHWQSTRVQTVLATRIAHYEDSEPEQRDVGRQVGPDAHELFVSCDPAEALQQQFEHLQPVYIAVHDVGTASSRQLLAGIAAASQRALQKLVIRRQGYGTPLATLEFVELSRADATMPLRVYTTATDADTASRHALAQMLLAYSRLGVVMVGDLPGHALAAALAPLRERVCSGPWPNRQLLLLPLAGASALATQGAELGRGTGVTVRTTPQVTRPADAWSYISGTWSRLDGSALGTRPAPSVAPASQALHTTPLPGAGAHQSPLPLRPMPDVPQAGAPAPGAPGADIDPLLERHVAQLMSLRGFVAACVFDPADRRPLAQAGTMPAAPELARHGSALLAALLDANRALRLGPVQVPETAISFGERHLVLRGVPARPGLALLVVLDLTATSPTLARSQIAQLDAGLEPAGANRTPA